MPSRRAAGSIQRYPPRLVEIISTPDDRSKPEFDSQNRWETGYSLAQFGSDAQFDSLNSFLIDGPLGSEKRSAERACPGKSIR